MADFDGSEKPHSDSSFMSEKKGEIFENAVEVLRETKAGEIKMMQEMDKAKSLSGLEETGKLIDKLSVANPGTDLREVVSDLAQNLNTLFDDSTDGTKSLDDSFRKTVRIFENLESSDKGGSTEISRSEDSKEARDSFFGVMLAGISSNLNDIRRETGKDKDLFVKKVIGGVAKGYEIAADLADKFPRYYKDMKEKVDLNSPFDHTLQYNARSQPLRFNYMAPLYGAGSSDATSTQVATEKLFQLLRNSDIGKRG